MFFLTFFQQSASHWCLVGMHQSDVDHVNIPVEVDQCVRSGHLLPLLHDVGGAQKRTNAGVLSGHHGANQWHLPHQRIVPHVAAWH